MSRYDAHTRIPMLSSDGRMLGMVEDRAGDHTGFCEFGKVHN